MRLKRLINVPNVGNFARFHREVMAHKAIEIAAIGLLPKLDLHWSPVVLIESRLMLWLQPHQDKVANQIGLT